MCEPIRFNNEDYCISIEHYRNTHNGSRIALILENVVDSDYIAIATINIPEEQLAEDEVIIKDYSENEGMLHTLVSAHIISVPVRFVKSGNIKAPICKLLIR